MESFPRPSEPFSPATEREQRCAACRIENTSGDRYTAQGGHACGEGAGSPEALASLLFSSAPLAQRDAAAKLIRARDERISIDARAEGQECGARDVLDRLEGWMARSEEKGGFYVCTPTRVFEVLRSWVDEQRGTADRGDPAPAERAVDATPVHFRAEGTDRAACRVLLPYTTPGSIGGISGERWTSDARETPITCPDCRAVLGLAPLPLPLPEDIPGACAMSCIPRFEEGPAPLDAGCFLCMLTGSVERIEPGSLAVFEIEGTYGARPAHGYWRHAACIAPEIAYRLARFKLENARGFDGLAPICGDSFSRPSGVCHVGRAG